MNASVTSADLRAVDVMSSPVATAPESSSLWHAGDLMIGLGIHHVVVVKADHCIGVLTDRDVLEAWHRGPAAIRSTPVGRLVAASTACVLPEAPLSQVASVMNVNHVDAVPVVDETGKLLGLVTAGDIVHAVATHGLAGPVESARPD
jgi:CBS domain-containing protein